MHDVVNHCAPSKITDLFVRSDCIHSHNTRFSGVGNVYVQRSRTNQQLYYSFQELGQESGTKFLRLKLRKLSKMPFKKKLHKGFRD